MMENPNNPAAKAAELAQKQVHNCIDKNQSFLLDAGAGSGKTYSLVEALKYLIAKREKALARNWQQVACVTYTNIATDEIRSRIDGHPAVMCSTIHAFCWSLLKNFQPHLRTMIPVLNDKWIEKISDVGNDIGQRRVGYDDAGYRHVDDVSVSLHHDDVLKLFGQCLENKKFRRICAARYPVLFIDEYQDTDRTTVDALKKHLLLGTDQMLIGFFGDEWQQIYDKTCGRIEHGSLVRIGKGSNFRSAAAVVGFLNAMRTELPQEVVDPANEGSVQVFHTNAWVGERLTGQHQAGDLPPEIANKALEMVRELLRKGGWEANGSETKILMLTHKRLADQQKYREVADCFEYNDAFVKKQDPHIKYFADTVEPAWIAYQAKQYGQFLTLIGGRSSGIGTHSDKLELAAEMGKISTCRDSGTIGEMIEILKAAKFFRFPDALVDKEKGLEEANTSGDVERQQKMAYLTTLKALPYRQMVALTEFINNQTPFSTKHGVKGAEFDDVLIVCGRGWSKYNFGQLMEWLGDVSSVPAAKRGAFVENRNLFYVACSRPKKRLAILFTQRLSDTALNTLTRLCNGTAITKLPM